LSLFGSRWLHEAARTTIRDLLVTDPALSQVRHDAAQELARILPTEDHPIDDLLRSAVAWRSTRRVVARPDDLAQRALWLLEVDLWTTASAVPFFLFWLRVRNAHRLAAARAVLLTDEILDLDRLDPRDRKLFTDFALASAPELLVLQLRQSPEAQDIDIQPAVRSPILETGAVKILGALVDDVSALTDAAPDASALAYLSSAFVLRSAGFDDTAQQHCRIAADLLQSADADDGRRISVSLLMSQLIRDRLRDTGLLPQPGRRRALRPPTQLPVDHSQERPPRHRRPHPPLRRRSVDAARPGVGEHLHALGISPRMGRRSRQGD
jgi:hypothetical protein